MSAGIFQMYITYSLTLHDYIWRGKKLLIKSKPYWYKVYNILIYFKINKLFVLKGQRYMLMCFEHVSISESLTMKEVLYIFKFTNIILKQGTYSSKIPCQ